MQPDKRSQAAPSLESLEARLRALPQPLVPLQLEARLLATVPAETLIPRWRRAVRVGLAGAAAACVLILLAWPRRDGKDPIVKPRGVESVHQVTPRLPDDSDNVVPWRTSRRVLDGVEMSPFTWPLAETSPLRRSTSIPPELFD